LIPALLISIAVGWRRRGLSSGSFSLADAIGLLIVAGVASVPYLIPLVTQQSLGPVAYQVYDAPNYAALIDGLANNTTRASIWGPSWDQTAWIGAHFGHDGFQQVGFDSVAATVKSLVGLGAVTSHSSFMIALILVGSLGLGGVVAALMPRWRPAWVLGGALFAGPVVYQLWLDGSEAAIAGLALLAPALLLGIRLMDDRAARSDVALFALFCAALQTSYPLTFPTFAVTALLVGLVWVAWRLVKLREGGSEGQARFARRVLLGVVGIVAGTALLSPWAFLRNLRYWENTLSSDSIFTGLPQFDLPLPVLPSYVLQTREFYFLPHLSDVSVQQWIVGDLLPIALLALACFAVIRVPKALPIAVFALVAAVLAGWASTRSDCSYCVQRALLSTTPALCALLAVGAAAIAELPQRWAKAAAWFVVLMIAVSVGHTDTVLVRRALHGAYMMPTDVSETISAIGRDSSPVFLEGFGASWAAPIEFQAVLHAVREQGEGRIAFPTETDDFSGLAYLGGVRPAGLQYTPDYKTVLTRLPSIRTQRRVISRHGSFALEERTGRFDAVIVSGVVTPTPRMVGAGRATVFAPMTFWISGPVGRSPSLAIEVSGVARNQVQPLEKGWTVRTMSGGNLEICTPVAQRGSLRRIVVRLDGLPVAVAPPPTFSARPSVIEGPQLKATRLVSVCGKS
jgi:hypothetical protein